MSVSPMNFGRGRFTPVAASPVDEIFRQLGGDIGCALGECKSLVDTTIAIIRLMGADEVRVLPLILDQLELGGQEYLAKIAPARELVIVPGKAAKAGPGLSEEEAVEHVRNGGDVIARDKSIAKRIAESAGEGPPAWDPPHGPGQKPHYHPTGPSGDRVGGHVLY